MNKFFNLEVKPTLLASLQAAGAFGDGDVLIDWHAFDIPNGGNLLRDAFMITKTSNGVPQTHAVEVFFARDINGVAPGTLGTNNATANGNQYQNHLIGYLSSEEADDTATTIDIPNLQRLQNNGVGQKYGLTPSLVLQGEPNTGTLKGYSRVYVGITSIDGAPSFAGTVQCDGIQGAGTRTLTVKTTSALTNFGVGDILYDEDDRLLGTVKTVDSATVITIEGNKGLVNATVDNKDVYPYSPIRLQLSFER